MTSKWFRKTTVFSYDTCIDELKHQVHELIDRNIRYLYQSSPHGAYSFQFSISDSLPLTRDSYVRNIGPDVYFNSVRRVLANQSYIVYPTGGQHGFWYNVCIVQTPNTIRPISVRLARAAIRVAQDANENCAIMLEPLRSVTAFAVSHCGHVFSEVAAELSTCPLCKSPATWTVCGVMPP
jgi:hypothetical protein